MANLQLVAYFNQNKGKYSVDQLKQTLIRQGYAANDVNEAARMAQSSSPAMPQAPTSSKMDPTSFFNIDQQTKDTITASIVGLLIAQVLIFFGDFLVGSHSLVSVIWTIIYAVIGGIIAGFLLSKLYYPFMDFISSNVSFLLPFCNTFFKLLFVPVIIGSIISLFFGLLIGGAVFAAGAALGAGLGGSLGGSSGALGGGLLGGVLGGSIILMTIWSVVVAIVGRYIYAKYMVSKVGNYYRDYRQ